MEMANVQKYVMQTIMRSSFWATVSTFPLDEMQTDFTDSEGAHKLAVHAFATHFASVLMEFLRLSYWTKLEFANRLLLEIKDLEVLSMIFSSLRNSMTGKTAIYAHVEPSTTFIYDMALMDRNRSIDGDILEKWKKEEQIWFANLSPEKQEFVLLTCIRVGGGSVVRKMYQNVGRHYNNMLHLNGNQGNKESSLETLQKHETLLNTFQMDSDVEKTEPKEMTELELKTKAWWDHFKKEHARVCNETGQLKNPENTIKSKGKQSPHKSSTKNVTTKKKKTDKIKKNSKSKKAPIKNSKSASADKAEVKISKKLGKSINSEISEYDALQLLPVYIVMDIFDYLTPKDLEQCKKVNQYWNCFAQKVADEKKIRKLLDKEIYKLKNKMKSIPSLSEAISKTKQYQFTWEEKQWYKTTIRGVVDKSFFPIKSSKKGKDAHGLSTTVLKTYSRDPSQEVVGHQPPFCEMKDINLTIKREIAQADQVLCSHSGSESAHSEFSTQTSPYGLNISSNVYNNIGSLKSDELPVIGLYDT